MMPSTPYSQNSMPHKRSSNRNPFSRVRLVKMQNGKTRFLSTEKEDRLLHKLEPVYGSWARLAMLTGMRLGERFRLR